jgi:3-hydroxyisobutyrate dehydrogenase-like beta-hydroxyacid dehydrogenase
VRVIIGGMENERTFPAFALIGFGEAGQAIAEGLRGEGATGFAAWDILFPDEARGAPLREAAGRLGVRVARDCPDALRGADVVVSAVTASSNLDAARSAAPDLQARQFYLDINSVSPKRKREAAAIVGDRARFVDVAVMAPILPLRHRTPMLVSGPAAAELTSILARCGMSMQDAGPEVGAAIGMKMVRSVMIKGLEALTQECFLAARAAGVEESVVASLAQTFPTLDWASIADYNLERMASHGIRRAAEMREVAQTLEELGVEPLMTRGTIERQQRTGDAKLKEAFGGKVPQDRAAILDKLCAAAKGGRA